MAVVVVLKRMLPQSSASTTPTYGRQRVALHDMHVRLIRRLIHPGNRIIVKVRLPDAPGRRADFAGKPSFQGSEKVNMAPPAAIVTICFPFSMYVIGFAAIVPSRLIRQSSFPLSASRAKE